MSHVHSEECEYGRYVRPPRYPCTGHRAPIEYDLEPCQTRELPIWYWPFELVGRLETRLLAKHEVEFFRRKPWGAQRQR